MRRKIWLVMETPSGDGRPFPIAKERTVIGQAAATDVRIPIPSVAPRHCEIVYDGQELRLNDFGSIRGTLHNGVRVQEAVLGHADRVTVGPVTFRVRVQQEDGAGPLAEIKIAPLAPAPRTTASDAS